MPPLGLHTVIAKEVGGRPPPPLPRPDRGQPRPQPPPLGANRRANIMDRAIQFSLDRERRIDRELMAHVLEAVARSDLALEIDFIDGDTLHRWRELILDVVDHPPRSEEPTSELQSQSNH